MNGALQSENKIALGKVRMLRSIWAQIKAKLTLFSQIGKQNLA